MSKPIIIHNDQGTEHQCTGYIADGWAVFTCPDCPKYERRINLTTHQNIVKGKVEHIRHAGTLGQLIAQNKFSKN